MASFAKIKKLEEGSLAGGAVLKADEYLVYMDAEAMRKSAEEEAQAIIAAAKSKAKLVEEEAFQEGLNQARSQVASEMVALGQAKDKMLKDVGAKVPSIIQKVVTNLLGTLPKPELVATLLQQAIKEEALGLKLVVKVHPSCKDAALEVFTKLDTTDMTIKVVAEDSFCEDQCVVESELGVVDASLQGLLEKLREVLAVASS